MHQFIATFIKDLLILWRDKAGMLVLFVMPMALVLIVSLVQNNVLEATGQSALQVLFVDLDQGNVSHQLQRRLISSGSIKLIDNIEDAPLTAETARAEVSAGRYQFGIIIPKGTSENLQENIDHFSATLFSREAQENTGTTTQIELFFDPTVQGAFRATVLSSLRYAALGLEMEQKGQKLSRTLQQRFQGNRAESTKDTNIFGEKPLLQINEQSATGGELKKPNATQQNVPAWSLFGMFFIVVPLSTALLRERQEGTLFRLFAHPIAYEIIIAGKIAAYVVVCLIQFSLMLLAGKYLLPLLGTPTLYLGEHIFTVFLLAFCAALAATGYGLLLGTIVRTYDQGSMLGAVSVVIAAAMGGVMVPTYVMPPLMQTLSGYSPLAWGLDGFVKLFVRDGDLYSVLPNMGLLITFFIICLITSRLIFAWRYGKGSI